MSICVSAVSLRAHIMGCGACVCVCVCVGSKIYCEGVKDLLGHRCRQAILDSVLGFWGAVTKKGRRHRVRKQNQGLAKQVSDRITPSSISSIHSHTI